MYIDTPLQTLRARVAPLERLIHAFANSLGEPHLRSTDPDMGFRFLSPDVRYFCLLKGIRVVSALNASLDLARCGYTQEIAVLMRTVSEFTSHIKFVLSSDLSEEHRAEVKQYVEAFFADSRRKPGIEIKRAQVRQGLVHEVLGRTFDKYAAQDGEGAKPAAERYSNVYRIFSNYVHGKYPEIMDLYGGRPGRFHLRGMSNTPKDLENLATLETFIENASTDFALMVQGLSLRPLLEADPILTKWYSGYFRASSR